MARVDARWWLFKGPIEIVSLLISVSSAVAAAPECDKAGIDSSSCMALGMKCIMLNQSPQTCIPRLVEEMKAKAKAPPKAALPPPTSKPEAAFRFLEAQFTIDESMLGEPEPGLSRLQAVNGELCQLQCGFHYALGLHAVADIEFDFKMADVEQSTLKSEIDKLGRETISFGSALGQPVFRMRKRSQATDMSTQISSSRWSSWSSWSNETTAICRTKPNQGDMQRVLKAFSYLATSCGAKESPF